MRLTIFSRLTVGYFTIFLIMGGVNSYTLLKLHQLHSGTTQIINVDQRMLDLRKRLADSILSQMGYQKKYLITKDVTFRQQSLSAEDDFNKYLAEALRIADTPTKTDALNRILSDYEQYRSLILADTDRVERNQSNPRNRYEQEQEKLVERILEELKILEASSYRDIYVRMNMLSEAGSSSRRLSILMFVVAFILVIGTSLFTTRSITKPLMVLIEKTKEVSRGVFKGDLSIASPPEVTELASAFNVMCDKLKRVEKMKSEFFSTMSHELRTPLTSIKEGIGLLQDGVGGSMSDKQKRLLSILSEETYRLIGLVNSLLDLSKMEEGMMTYHFHDEHLSPLIKRVLTEMGPLMEGKKIKLQAEIGEELPPLRLDRERMLQVLRNLIGNAVKFTPEGGVIWISSHLRNEGVAFSVKDTGPGIPKENLQAVFEKFHQLPVKASAWMKGTGLGLAIVKHIVTAHGGNVWAESEPGQGSTFSFVVPFWPVS
jgi:two-component system sensor histidine kinase GlrK